RLRSEVQLTMRSLHLALAALAVTSLSCASKSEDPPLPPPSADASIDNIPIAAGDEKTVCIVKRLGNADAMLATKVSAELATGSPDRIINKSTATEEQLEPKSCAPFVGTVVGDEVPFILVGREKLEFEFPKGVGVSLEQNQMLKIEAHYINTSKEALTGS